MFTNDSLRGRDRDVQTLAREMFGFFAKAAPLFASNMNIDTSASIEAAACAHILERGGLLIADKILTTIENERRA